jgi:hypothetical protein
MREIHIGSIYRHFKGNEYKVIDIVNDCESVGDDIKKVVIYQALYGNHEKWARKYEDFASLVDHEKYPEIGQKFRFEEVKHK